LDQPHPTVLLRTPIPDDPRPPGLFAAEDPDLAAMLLVADEPTHRATLRWVLGLLADELDLRDEPAVGAVLDVLPHEWPTGGAPWGEVLAMRLRLQEEARTGVTGSPDGDRLRGRMFAGEAFTATVTVPYGRLGSLDALYYAQRALDERWPTIRAELWRRARHQRSMP
jgi:hypothetical protein